MFVLFAVLVFKSKVIAANRKFRTGKDCHEELKCTALIPLNLSRPDNIDDHRVSDVAVEEDGDDDAEFRRGVCMYE